MLYYHILSVQCRPMQACLLFHLQMNATCRRLCAVQMREPRPQTLWECYFPMCLNQVFLYIDKHNCTIKHYHKSSQIGGHVLFVEATSIVDIYLCVYIATQWLEYKLHGSIIYTLFYVTLKMLMSIQKFKIKLYSKICNKKTGNTSLSIGFRK